MFASKKKGPILIPLEARFSIIEILQNVPDQALVQLQFRDRTYLGIFRLKLKEEPSIAPTDYVQLFNVTELGTDRPTRALLTFPICEVQDGKM